jgi:Rha family phage regulatory protein
MELVKFENLGGSSVIATTSLKVAEFTGKAHSDVLFSISELIQSGGNSPDLNYQECIYKDGKNRSQKFYALDETFTTVLLMGFTGKDAVKWKITYTKAFQSMREELKVQPKIVARTKGDKACEFHKLVLEVAIDKRASLEGKTDHKGYCINIAKVVNTLCFGTHEPGIRQYMPENFEIRLNAINADVARLAIKGVTNPKQVYETLAPKYTAPLVEVTKKGGSK